MTAALFASVASARPAWSQSAEERASARQLVKDADKKLAAHDPDGAIELFEKAFALVRAPTIRLEQGRAELKLGRLIEAQQHLLEATRTVPAPGEPPSWVAARKDAATEAAGIDARLAFLELSVTPQPWMKPPQVSIDKMHIENTTLGVPRALNPGAHTIHVETEGADPIDQQMTLAEGERQKLALTLQESVAHKAAIAEQERLKQEAMLAEQKRVADEQQRLRDEAAKAEAERLAAEKAKRDREEIAAREEAERRERMAAAGSRRGWGWTFVGVGIAAGVGAGVFMGLGVLDNNLIKNGGLSNSSDISEAASTGATFNSLAIGLGIGAGVCLAVGIPLIVSGSGGEKPSAAASLSVSPMPVQNGQGVMTTLRF